jgi:hypothetical protein
MFEFNFYNNGGTMLRNTSIAAALCLGTLAQIQTPAQAAPVTVTTVSSGTAAIFDLGGDGGLGDGTGTGPYQLAITATFADWQADGVNEVRGDVGITLTYQGITRHTVQYGVYAIGAAAGSWQGESATILSQRFTSLTPGSLGLTYRFSQDIAYAPDVLAPDALPDELDLPLAARGGTFDLRIDYDTEVGVVPLGYAFGPVDAAGVRIASAVPEPATYAMLLAGLAVAGGAARRRARQHSLRITV